MGLALPGSVFRRGLRQGELPQGVLDDRFPHRGDTQVNFIGRVADGVAKGDTTTIVRLGMVMLGVTALQVLCSVGAIYFGSRTGVGLRYSRNQSVAISTACEWYGSIW